MENYNRKYECNVYYVKVIIEAPFNPNKKVQDGFITEANVLAISEEAAVKKITRQFIWDLRDKIKDGYTISHEVKLLVESVTY